MTGVAIDGLAGPKCCGQPKFTVPQPGPGEVLIRDRLCRVNRPDVPAAGALSGPARGFPLPGLEVSGTRGGGRGALIPRCSASRSARWWRAAGYAQYCTADMRHCLPVPKTCHGPRLRPAGDAVHRMDNVFRARLGKEGESLLVHARTTDRHHGDSSRQAVRADVIVTCGSVEKCTRALEIGAAHRSITRRRTSSRSEAGSPAATGSPGARHGLGRLCPAAPHVPAEDGRHVTIACWAARRRSLNMAVVMSRGYSYRFDPAPRRRSSRRCLRRNQPAVWPCGAGRTAAVDDCVLRCRKRRLPMRGWKRAIMSGRSCWRLRLEPGE